MTILEAILSGISRCATGSRSASLEEFYRRWKPEIDDHPERDRIIEAFKARKDEIKNVRKK